jgi:phenylalanyl-tRNA synthetase beta chain
MGEFNMPKLEVSYRDLCNLIGKRIEIEKLREYLLYAKSELDDINNDTLKIDVKDTNRPDLWSAEGISREIKLRLNKKFPIYDVKKSDYSVLVDKKVKGVRSHTVCAVVKNLKISPDILSQIIQLQEKVSITFGKNRKEIAIGVYDFNKIKWPIKYTTVTPDGIRFRPLEFEKEMSPKEILEKHPKGKEFGHLLKDAQEYPLFIDSAKNVLSMPPIINSDYTGKIDKNTKHVFIECSGFDLKFLNTALNVIVSALAERGGEIHAVKVVYPDKTLITPDLDEKKISIDTEYVNKVSGLRLTEKEIIDLLEKSGYKIIRSTKSIELFYPSYRQDIMHPRDVVEDIIISFGYNEIEPVIPKLPTTGRMHELEIISNRTAELCVGLGLQEILSYTLTNKFSLFEKMNTHEDKTAEIENPMSTNWSVFRSWLIPGILEFFSQNKHIEYPQNVFEIGNVVLLNDKEETRARDVLKLAVGLTDNNISYEKISSYLDAFLRTLGIDYKLTKKEHNSFIHGRCAEIEVHGEHVGTIGEIHPQVLNNWKLEKPVAAFEIDLEKMFGAYK